MGAGYHGRRAVDAAPEHPGRYQQQAGEHTILDEVAPRGRQHQHATRQGGEAAASSFVAFT